MCFKLHNAVTKLADHFLRGEMSSLSSISMEVERGAYPSQAIHHIVMMT